MKKLIYVLTLVAVANFAYGSNLNAQLDQPVVVDSPIKSQRELDLPIEIQQKLNSGEYNFSTTSVVNSQNTESIKKGCKLLVHIKGAHAEGDYEIFTKENFAKKDLERGILIKVWAQHETAASSKIESTIEIGDTIVCYKYKENSDKPTNAEL